MHEIFSNVFILYHSKIINSQRTATFNANQTKMEYIDDCIYVLCVYVHGPYCNRKESKVCAQIIYQSTSKLLMSHDNLLQRFAYVYVCGVCDHLLPGFLFSLFLSKYQSHLTVLTFV